jgi:hypothetical protein
MLTLWTVAPEMPVLVVGDRDASAHYSGDRRVTCQEVGIGPFQGTDFLRWYVKPLLPGLSPFESSLYVDADTLFEDSPACGFDMLDRWDVVLAETQTGSLHSSTESTATKGTVEWLGTPHCIYHSSGMLFWRKVLSATMLFDLWREAWLQNHDEQLALMQALLRSEAMYQTVPYTWHSRMTPEGAFLHHRFGTKPAGVAANARQLVPNDTVSGVRA